MGEQNLIGFERRYAVAAGAYLILLYGTLGVTPYFFRWLLRTVGRDAYSGSITLFLVACACFVLYRWRLHLRQITPIRALGLSMVGLGYGLISYTVVAAANRLHTLQYGLLVWLAMETIRPGRSLPKVYLLSFLFAIAAATVDESLQAWLPNRNGLPSDVLLDGFSVLLAQSAIFLVKDAPGLKTAKNT